MATQWSFDPHFMKSCKERPIDANADGAERESGAGIRMETDRVMSEWLISLYMCVCV